MQVNTISTFDLGLTHGYGLFETIRVYNGNTFLLERHIDRILNSSQELSFNHYFTSVEIKNLVANYIKDNNIGSKAIRFSISYGNKTLNLPCSLFISERPIPYDPAMYESGIKLKISELKKYEHSLIIKHKTFNQLENIISLNECKKFGFQECIFINTSGNISEGSISNIFIIKDGIIHTPSVECGILPGITRQYIIDICSENGIKVIEGKYSMEFLLNSDECFCTNSLMEVMPVASIDGKPVGGENKFSIANEILKKYREEVKDHIKRNS